MIGSFGLFLGAIFLIGGVFAYFYSQRVFAFAIYPYRDYAAPLIIAGIVLLVIGVVTDQRAKEASIFEKRYSGNRSCCPHCGEIRDAGAIYCKKCGQKLP
jgi:tRNA(Ile2) C34 agmatinyltransferase TiaS